jgi:hypothetical protein
MGNVQKPSNSGYMKVFKSKILKIIHGSKREELTDEWGPLHEVEVENVNFSLNRWITPVIKSSRIRLAGHVACIASMIYGYKTAIGKPNKRDHLGDIGVHGGRILKQLSNKRSMRLVTGPNCRNRKIILI